MTLTTPILLTLALTGCADPLSCGDGTFYDAGSNSCLGQEPGDNSLPAAQDCTPESASIDPPQIYYADLDGDGFGGTLEWEESCHRPKGFKDTADDCDDSDAQVHPQAEELCDAQDNDCDGRVDDLLECEASLEQEISSPQQAAEFCALGVEAEGSLRISGSDWEDLSTLACLQAVHGDLTLDLPLLEELSLPQLEYVGGDLELENNSATLSLQLPALSELEGTLRIGASALESLSVPSLQTLGGLSLQDNTGLIDLNLSSVQSIDGLLVEDCDLEEIVLDGALSLGQVTLSRLSNLRSFELPAATSVGDMSIYGAGLETLNLPSLRELGALQLNKTSITELDLSQLITLRGLALRDNNALQSISLSVSRVDGDLIFARNLALGAPDLSGITEVQGDLSFTYQLPEGPLDLQDVSVIGGNLILEYNGVTEVDLSPLSELGGLQVWAEGVTELDVLAFPEIQHLSITGNTSLTELAIPTSIRTMSGDLVLSLHDPDMRLDLSRIVQVDGEVSIYGLGGNTLDLGRLAIVGGELDIVGLEAQDLELGSLARAGALRVEDLPALTTLSLGALRECTTIELVDLLGVTELDLHKVSDLHRLRVERLSVTALDLSELTQIESLTLAISEDLSLDASQLTELQELTLAGMSGSVDLSKLQTVDGSMQLAGVDAELQLPVLREVFDLTFNGSGYQALPAMPSLALASHLNLYNNLLLEDLSPLYEVDTVLDVIIKNNPLITDQDAQDLVDSFGDNSHSDISGNGE